MESIKEKVVLVTGGSRGIGRAICLEFAEREAHVVVVYRQNEEAARLTINELRPNNHLSLKCDIRDPEAVTRLFEEVTHHYGQLDIVVNNAGIGFHHPVDECSYHDWQRGWEAILQTNLIAPSNICYHAAQVMMKQKSGKIINITSRGAFRGEPDQPAYGASKAGLNSLSQSLAYKLAPYNIFVGAIAPGFVETDMAFDRLQGESGAMIKAQSPMYRVAKPEEVAEAVILMALSNQWMTGTIFDVNGASYFRT